VLIPPVENHRRLLRPCAREVGDEPPRVRGAARGVGIDTLKQPPALGDEAPQYGVHQARGRVAPDEPRRLNRQMHRELRGVARVLDLMRACDEECPHFRGEFPRPVNE
jgi:hypothetical protein